MNHTPRFPRADRLGTSQPRNQLQRQQAERANRNDLAVLNHKQIHQMRNALALARSCLMSTHVDDGLKEAAIQELRIAMETIDRCAPAAR